MSRCLVVLRLLLSADGLASAIALLSSHLHSCCLYAACACVPYTCQAGGKDRRSATGWGGALGLIVRAKQRASERKRASPVPHKKRV
uniref:Putative secreted protein n=1 Tax=Anopheles darlingi TaxID=43151 RepID=A0A2M4DIB0_ANODA